MKIENFEKWHIRISKSVQATQMTFKYIDDKDYKLFEDLFKIFH